jgi:putative inorganic carbon (HCO3(-)) transporter
VTAELLARLGGPTAALGLALLVLVPTRLLKLAGLVLLAAGGGLFLPFLAPSDASVQLLLLAAPLALVVAAGLAVLFVRYPWSLAFLALAAVPARVPVSVGGVSASLLLPLYAVIAGAGLALAWRLLRDEREARAKELGWMSWPAALLVVWLGLSILWTIDLERGAVQLFFFVLPFGLLAVALARLPWNERAVAWLYRLLAAMALLFAAVGIWQWVTKDVFWNPRVIAWNVSAPFVRVNSLFWDPSMYGRFLVLAIVASVVVLLFQPPSRRDLAVGAAVVVLWTGLLFSFSQSSFVALIVSVALLAALAWRWRAALAIGAIAAIMIPVGFASPALEGVREALTSGSEARLDRATSGRATIVENGVRIAADRPAVGVGVGGFREAYADRLGLRREPEGGVSHTTPLTLAAEAGAIGLVLFAWLIAAAFLVALRGGLPGRDPAARAGIAVGAALAAVAVHSLFYNAFFEDPTTWGLLALAVVADRAREPRAAS